jgi:hypothetical protein
MKKTLIAMAAVAVAGVASAQVTITGAMGYGISDTSTGTRTADWTDGSMTLSASEDLGGGMSISGKSTIAFNGQSGDVTSDGNSLSLTTAAAGSLAVGSANADADKLGVASLPYSTGHLFGGTGATATTVNGTAGYQYVQYNLPTLIDGLSVGVRWAGTEAGVAMGAGAVEQYRFAFSAAGVGIEYNTKTGASDLLVSYTLEGITIKAFNDTAVASGTDKRQEYSISAPVGGMTVAASTATKGALKGTEVAATVALSKRTSVSIGFGSFTGSTAGTTSANRVKLVHTF